MRDLIDLSIEMSRDARIAALSLIADQMIREQREHEDYWLYAVGLEDRSNLFNAVVITTNPEFCVRITYEDGQWIKHADALTADEMGEFFAAFGSHWGIFLNSWINCPDPKRVRAFIKNGRKRGGFSISLDLYADAKDKAA